MVGVVDIIKVVAKFSSFSKQVLAPRQISRSHNDEIEIPLVFWDVFQQPSNEFLPSEALLMIANLAGRSDISAFARMNNAEICLCVNGKPARNTFWLSPSAPFPDSGSEMVTVNCGGNGGDKEGGDTVRSTSVALPFPRSNRGFGLGDFSISTSKTWRGGAGDLSSDIAEVVLLPKPRKRWVTRSESVGWRAGVANIVSCIARARRWRGVPICDRVGDEANAEKNVRKTRMWTGIVARNTIDHTPASPTDAVGNVGVV